MKEEEQGEGEELGKIFLSYSSHWLGTLINEPSDVAPEIRAGEQHQRHIPNDPHCPCSCPILSWCHTVQQKRNPDPSPFREKEQWDGHFQEYLETYTGLGTTTMGIDQATCPVALDIIQDIFRTNLFPTCSSQICYLNLSGPRGRTKLLCHGLGTVFSNSVFPLKPCTAYSVLLFPHVGG